MSSLSQLYKRYKNGIIFTLLFHILVFIALNVSQFNIKQDFKETELLIDFPDVAIEQTDIPEVNKSENSINSTHNTNIASNRSLNRLNEVFDEKYQKELEEAQNLVKDVSSQLAKEIPTINDLQMPEETTEGMDPDSIINKLYSGNSNVEYFLENRFHTRLPIPVYLSQTGGVVTVNIIVDGKGNVIKAEPIVEPSINEKTLSYAKTAALRTKFNPSIDISDKQSGYIKYTFIAQ